MRFCAALFASAHNLLRALVSKNFLLQEAAPFIYGGVLCGIKDRLKAIGGHRDSVPEHYKTTFSILLWILLKEQKPETLPTEFANETTIIQRTSTLGIFREKSSRNDCCNLPTSAMMAYLRSAVQGRNIQYPFILKPQCTSNSKKQSPIPCLCVFV